MAAITRICLLLNLFAKLRVAYSQFPFPMYPHMGAPIAPMIPMAPPPVPVPVPVPIAIRFEDTTTTTSTAASSSESKENSIAIAVPFPLPVPIHMAIPAAPPPTYCQQRSRPYNCPPCPPCTCSPSCTPAFFSYCSPCHKNCRCRSNALVPLPPPRYRQKKYHKTSSSCDDSHSSSSSSSSSERVSGKRKMRRRRNKRKSLQNMRRNFEVSDIETNGRELIKPVLTYISRNGDIKFKKQISNNEAAHLLGETRGFRAHQNIKVTGGEDSNGKSQVVVLSNDVEELSNDHSRKRIVLREGTSQHVLGEGKKELIFRPANDKEITNLSVSFQVAS